MNRKSILLILLAMILASQMLRAQQMITFTLNAISPINSIHVVGDFNNWSKTANPMSDPDGDGIWQATMRLEPGEYQYRFLLNDLIWIKDPNNPAWGGEHSNSLLCVKNPQHPELTNLTPDMGATIRSSSVTISAQYIDGSEKQGIDLNNSKIYLNGTEHKFSYHPKLNRMECYFSHIEDGEYHVEILAQDVKGNRARPLSGFFLINRSNHPPVVDAGNTIITGIHSTVFLNSGTCYDPDKDPLRKYNWKLTTKPANSKAKLKKSHSAFPHFTPDKIGRYLFTVTGSDGQAKSSRDSVDVYAFTKRDYPVEFSLSDSAFAAIYECPIDSVSVAGEFNRWSATATPMTDYNHDGVWTTWVDLEPGEYEYKFVVNGKHWIADPNNMAKVPDGWNGFNSVVSASLNLSPVVDVKSTFKPGNIIFDASASYGKSTGNLNFFWYQDINNPRRFDLPSESKISIRIPEESGTYYYYLVVTDAVGVSSQKTLVLNINQGVINIRDFSQSPDWAKDAIVYEIFVRKFTPEGNLRGLLEKIPYLKSLGINCLWLMPIWDGPTSHGYGPSDFFAIEKDYGTMDDFNELVEQAHQAGMRIILDFVANHTSDQHPYFRSAYQNPISSFRDWYRWFPPHEQIGYYPYQFHNDWDNLPNLNYENPNVRKYIIDAAAFWAGLGVDGFRCDVAWGVPHDFWKLFRRSLKHLNPDFLIIDEVLPRSPAYHQDEFDMSYDTDFYGNLLDVMNGRKSVSAIEYGLNKTRKNYPSYTLDFRYLENHDMERFVAQFGLNKTRLGATLLLTIPGTPLIYYGQEIGLREKTPPMEWNRSDDPLLNFYKKLIRLRRQHACFRRGGMIKVPTNYEDKVYAYLRQDKETTFLVVLNFGDQIEDCQLLFPEGALSQHQKENLHFENLLTSEQILIDLIRERQIKLKLQAESGLIFKIMN